ncbi:transposase [bacterium endosymbiont of Escarpia laminata]|nr:MAG: transposase [bacterium endosymbiont of Escarpia laminata]
MPRQGRVVLPGFPHHIVQRGHDRKVVFAAQEDYLYYLDSLAEFKRVYEVRVYAYCLMTNHVHLLLEPSAEKGLAQLMKRLAGRQTRYRNRNEGRSGTLWESRYKSSPVDTNGYLFECMRYVELNPVRAKMVSAPDEYPWSSYSERIGNVSTHLLDPIPGQNKHGKGDLGWVAAYQQFIQTAVPDGEWQKIREAAQRGQLTGNSVFVDQVETILGRRVEWRQQGRPRMLE